MMGVAGAPAPVGMTNIEKMPGFVWLDSRGRLSPHERLYMCNADAPLIC